jgi:prolyl oligopeptidase family protein
MKKHLIILASVMTLNGLQAQQPLTPEKLWELHRVSAIALTPDQQYVLVSVSTPNVKENTFNKEYYKLAVKGGVPIPISKEEVEKLKAKYNTDKSLKLTHKEVKLKSVLGKDIYTDLDKIIRETIQ